MSRVCADGPRVPGRADGPGVVSDLMPQDATKSTIARPAGRDREALRLRGLCEAAREMAGVDHAWAAIVSDGAAAVLQAIASGSGVRKAWRGEAHPAAAGLLRGFVEGREAGLGDVDRQAEAFGMPPSCRLQFVVAIATPDRTYGCLCLGGGERAEFGSAKEWLVRQLAGRFAQAHERALQERRPAPARPPAPAMPPPVAADASLEDERRHERRLAEVGRLASEVAHDLNNQLTTIFGHGEMVLRKLPAESPLHGHIRELTDAAERAATLTRQLQAFSRPQPAQPRALDLNAAVAEMVGVLQRATDRRVRLTSALAPGLERIEADPGLLEEVIVNLIAEARDAIGGAGRIDVETARWTPAGAPAGTSLTSRRGVGYAQLIVTGWPSDADAGPHHRPGSAEAAMASGERSGIGLAAARRIVDRLGGLVLVEAGPGTQTTFRACLPGAGGERQPAPAEASRAGLPHGARTLLLVEDEPAVRELEICVLLDQGYRVLKAEDGQEALEILQGPLHPVPDLLVTDLVMPRLGGRALADLARRLHPQMKVLCISGDAEGGTAGDPPLHAAALLRKPFTIEELTGKIREVLEAFPE